MQHTSRGLFPKIESLIISLDFESISEEREKLLRPFIEHIRSQHLKNDRININFICTHNSRRSHLAQIWAQTMAYYYNFDQVNCYSGGTEATAVFPVIIQTLEKQGFQVQKISQDSNPIYAIKYSENEHPVIGFSKKMNNGFNPNRGFAAVMTCGSANEACPVVSGATQRIPITYEDPKVFDGTTQQAEKYTERSLQIAAEMRYVFSKI